MYGGCCINRVCICRSKLIPRPPYTQNPIVHDFPLDPVGFVLSQISSSICSKTYGNWQLALRILERLSGQGSEPSGSLPAAKTKTRGLGIMQPSQLFMVIWVIPIVLLVFLGKDIEI